MSSIFYEIIFSLYFKYLTHFKIGLLFSPLEHFDFRQKERYKWFTNVDYTPGQRLQRSERMGETLPYSHILR